MHVTEVFWEFNINQRVHWQDAVSPDGSHEMRVRGWMWQRLCNLANRYLLQQLLYPEEQS